MVRVPVWTGAIVLATVLGQGIGVAQVCPSNAAVCRDAQRTRFIFKNRSDDAKDKLIWRWLKGEATTTPEFLDPQTTVSTALCLYAGTAAALIGEMTVPPDGTLWHQGSTGINNGKLWYKDKSAAADGVHYMLLRSGTAGKARIVVKARGSALPDLPVPFPSSELPLTVQLHQSDGTPCWGATYNSLRVNAPSGSKIKAMTP